MAKSSSLERLIHMSFVWTEKTKRPGVPLGKPNTSGCREHWTGCVGGMRRMLTEPFIQKAKHKALDLVVANEQEKAGLQVEVKGVLNMQRPREKRGHAALKMM